MVYYRRMTEKKEKEGCVRLEKNFYTTSEMCLKLNVSRSTLNRWVDEFPGFVFAEKTVGGTFFRKEMLGRFEFIKRARDNNFSIPDINTVIRKRGLDEALPPLDGESSETGLSVSRPKKSSTQLLDERFALLSGYFASEMESLFDSLKREIAVSNETLLERFEEKMSSFDIEALNARMESSSSSVVDALSSQIAILEEKIRSLEEKRLNEKKEDKEAVEKRDKELLKLVRAMNERAEAEQNRKRKFWPWSK